MRARRLPRLRHDPRRAAVGQTGDDPRLLPRRAPAALVGGGGLDCRDRDQRGHVHQLAVRRLSTGWGRHLPPARRVRAFPRAHRRRVRARSGLLRARDLQPLRLHGRPARPVRADDRDGALRARRRAGASGARLRDRGRARGAPARRARLDRGEDRTLAARVRRRRDRHRGGGLDADRRHGDGDLDRCASLPRVSRRDRDRVLHRGGGARGRSGGGLPAFVGRRQVPLLRLRHRSGQGLHVLGRGDRNDGVGRRRVWDRPVDGAACVLLPRRRRRAARDPREPDGDRRHGAGGVRRDGALRLLRGPSAQGRGARALRGKGRPHLSHLHPPSDPPQA